MAKKKPQAAYLGEQQDLNFDAGEAFLATLRAPAQPAAELENRGALRGMADVALAGGRGAVQGVRMLTDLAGADNGASRALRSVEDYISGLRSAQAQQDDQAAAAIMKAAENAGILDQVIAGAKAFAQAPISTLAQAVGTSIPTVAAALMPGAGQVAAAGRMAGALGLGAAQGAGSVKGQIYDEVKQELLQAGASPAEAERRALEASSYAQSGGKIATGAALGAVAGSTGMERAVGALARGVTKDAPGMARRVLGGGVVEAVPEAAQGAQEKLASNQALYEQGFDVAPGAGVVAAGTMEGLAGFGMGAAAGVPRPAVRPGDQLRVEGLQPERGPATRALNAAVEAAAKMVDAGAPMPADPALAAAGDTLRAAAGVATPEPVLQPVEPVDLEQTQSVEPAPAVEPVRTSEPGAIAQREADRPAEPKGEPQDGDILNSQGKPFRNQTAALRALEKAGGESAAEIAVVKGGWVIRPRAQEGAVTDAAAAGGPAVEQPADAGRSDGTAGVRDSGPANLQDGAAAPADQVRAGDGAADVRPGGVGPAPELTHAAVEPAAQAAAAEAPAPAAPAAATAADVPGARAGAVETDGLTGPKIDDEWTAFAPESGTKGVPRADMPQIKAGDRSSMVQFLRARGIDYQADIEVPAADLKPTQAEFSPAKVAKAQAFTDGDRSILVSSDGYVLDGHHQWMAKRKAGEPVKVIKLDAPIDRLLAEVREFPSAQAAEGAAVDRAAQWDAMSAADRLPVLTRAGWTSGSKSTQAMQAKPWAKLSEKQRDRVTEAMGAAPASEVTPAPAADLTSKSEAKPEVPPPERTAAVPQSEPSSQDTSTSTSADASASQANPEGAKTSTTTDAAAAEPGVVTVDVADAAKPDSAAETDSTESAPANESTSIQDVGEKIGGARKDRWKERGLDVADLNAMSEAEGATHATKANVWKPDYEAMAAATDPVTAAMVKVIYDGLAAKPKADTPQGRRDYVQAMQAVRKVYGNVKTVQEARDAYALLREELGVRARQGSGFSDTGDKDAKRVLFSVYKGRSDPFVFDYNRLASARKLVKDGFPNVAPWKRRFVVREYGGAGITPRGVELVVQDAERVGTPLSAEQVRAGYAVVAGKTGGPTSYHATKADAEAAAAAQYERTKGNGDDKAEPERPHLDKLAREGLPQRLDRDVTAEDFRETFGWRGVEFGNWAAQGERQRLLNMAFDGLSDLADILGVPPKALSLNGTMGLAFGARGRGRFAAHYEPGKMVINMTKLRGAGSLAHEWAHALDHYLGELDRADAYQGKARGASGWLTQDRYSGALQRRMVQRDGRWAPEDRMRLENLRPELARLIDGVMKRLYETPVPQAEAIAIADADVKRTVRMINGETDPKIRKVYEDTAERQRQLLADLQAGKPSERTTMSSYAKEAQKLSGKSADGYWLRPTEMFARAFESYVFDRLVAMGARSDYLVHGVEQDRFADGTRFKGNPYPTGDERQAIGEAFDAMVRELKTRDGGGGNVALFSRGAIDGPSVNLGSAQAMARDLAAKGLVKLNVVQSVTDLPDKLRGEVLASTKDGRIRGAYVRSTDQVWLVADHIRGADEFVEVALHEAFHRGLGKLIPETKPVLLEIWRTNQRVKQVTDEQMRLHGIERDEAIEEALAKMAEAGEVRDLKGWPKLLEAIRTWLGRMARAVGVEMTWTDDMVADLVAAATREGLRAGVHVDAGQQQMAASRTESALQALSKMDELFALPRLSGKTVSEIAFDLDPTIKVVKLREEGPRQTWRVTLPNGGYGDITIRKPNPYGPDVYGFDLSDGEMVNLVTERPGDNPEDVPATDDVWIDVSQLKTGQGGNQIYAIAAALAHNTGRIFIGDPNGLSKIALRRRAENMASLAMRYGTTRFLAPHPDQIKGSKDEGVPPLQWVYGDDEGNAERLIALNIQAVENAFPDVAKIEFDAASGEYINAVSGARIDRDRLVGRAVERRQEEASDSPSVRAAAAGRTVARAAVLRALSRGEGSESAGGRGRTGLLDRLGAAASGPAADSLKGLFSRVEDPADMRSLVTVQGIQARAHDLLTTQRSFNWWHRTVGTQYHKAQVDKDYRRVYDAAQNYLHDTSAFANDPADLAPDLLPQLKSLGDLKKSLALPKADRDKLAAAVFEGTLDWTRDSSGTAVQATGEDTPGIVWTPAELRDRFGFDDHQVELYQQFRASVDRSLDTLVAADVARLLGDELPQGMRAMISSGDLGRFRGVVRAVTQQRAEAARAELVDLRRRHRAEMGAFWRKQKATLEGEGGRAGSRLANQQLLAEERAAIKLRQGGERYRAEQAAKQAAELEEMVRGKFERIDQLKAAGYAPLMRFGRYTVDVVGPAGDRQFFGLYESQAEANQAARAFRETSESGTEVNQGVLSEEAYKQFQGMTPETLELFAEVAGVERNEVFQEYLRRAKNNRSALKRLIHRKGVAGYSEDASRVLAQFLVSNARAASGSLHMGELGKAIQDIPKEKGDVIDEAIRLREYVQNPQEEAQALRGLLFAMYLGGSVASAMVNMTQPLMMTLPYLSQFGGPVAAAQRLAGAVKAALGRYDRNSALGQALALAEKEGIVSPQELHQLQAEASSSLAKHPVLRRMSFAWGALFSAAEQFNRRLTFVAAFNTAVARGMDNPAQFAAKAVDETQGVYNKGNKPRWARGAVGATLFTFKQYSVSYLEFLKRLPTRERTLALAVLLLAAGAQGMPGADDLDDLIDTLGQGLGYDTNAKLWKTRVLSNAIGADGADFVLRGFSALPGFPLDVAGRLGLGNLIPGTGLLMKSKLDKAGEVSEALGPAASLASGVAKAVPALATGNVGGVMDGIAPKGIKDLRKALEMYQTGEYRDTKGRKVADATGTDALVKGLGFQPAHIAGDSRRVQMANQQIALARATEAEFADAIARARVDGDREAEQQARQRLVDWNARNPESRIIITPSQVARRARELRTTRDDRFVRSATREMRQAVREIVQ